MMKEFCKSTETDEKSERARSVATLVELSDETGENRAVDRKVRLDAAKALLGKHMKALSVSVSVNNTQAVTTRPG